MCVLLEKVGELVNIVILTSHLSNGNQCQAVTDERL